MGEADRKNRHQGRLYFKANDRTHPACEEYGMKPFRPSDKQTLKNYYEIPPDILEGGQELVLWAREAVRFIPSQK